MLKFIKTAKFRIAIITVICLMSFFVFSPEPTQASADPPAGRVWLIKPGYGIGPVRLRMNFDDVYSMFGQPEQREGKNGDWAITWKYRCGNGTLEICFWINTSLYNLEYTVASITVRGAAPCETKEGVAPNSSPQEIVSRMGRGYKTTGDPTSACRRDYGGLEISTANGRIYYMSVYDSNSDGHFGGLPRR